MKNFGLKCFLICFSVGNIFGCSFSNYESNHASIENSSKLDFSPYYDIRGNIAVYCWLDAENLWKCGLNSYFSPNFPRNVLEIRHMQECLPCDLSVMKEILYTYYSEEVRNNAFVLIIPYPFESNNDVKNDYEYVYDQLGLKL